MGIFLFKHNLLRINDSSRFAEHSFVSNAAQSLSHSQVFGSLFINSLLFFTQWTHRLLQSFCNFLAASSASCIVSLPHFCDYRFSVVSKVLPTISSLTGGEAVPGGEDRTSLHEKLKSVLREKRTEFRLPLLLTFVESFHRECVTSETVTYGNCFGDGKWLIASLVGAVATVIESVLFGTNVHEGIILLVGHPGFAKTLGLLQLLGEDKFHVSPSVWKATVECIVEVTSQRSLPALLIRVHATLLEILLDVKAKETLVLDLAPSDASIVAFLSHLFACYRSDPSLMAVFLKYDVLDAFARTFELTLSRQFEGSAALSEATRGIITLLLTPGLCHDPILMTEDQWKMVEESFLRALHAPPAGTHLTRDMCPLLESLVCCMEGIACVRSVIGHPAVETIDFGVTFSTILPLQASMAQRSDLGERLFCCICQIATASRTVRAADKAARGTKGVATFFSAVFTASQVSTFQQLVSSVGGTAVKNRSGVTCREAVECMTSFFVCATEEVAADTCGDALFNLLCRDDMCEELIHFSLHSCLENLFSLRHSQLRRVLELLRVAVRRGLSVSGFVLSLVKVLEGGSNASCELKLSVLEFLNFHLSVDANNSLIELLHGVFRWILEEITSITAWNDPILLKYLLGVTNFVESSLFCAPLVTLLGKVEWPRKTLFIVMRAHDEGCTEVGVTLRSHFRSLVKAEGQFIDSLISELRVMGGKNPWPEHVSTLLRVFVHVVKDEAGALAAIRCNDIYVCLYLLHAVDHSTRFEVDVHLIGTSLALLLSHLRWSEAGGVVVHYVEAIKTPWMIQLLSDICTGFYISSENLNVVDNLDREAMETMVSDARSQCTVVGRFFLPLLCFCEHTFPLVLLTRWIAELEDHFSGMQKELSELLHAILRGCRPLITDAMFATVVAEQEGLRELVPYVADLTRGDVSAHLLPPKEALTCEDVATSHAVWEALVRSRLGEGLWSEISNYVTLRRKGRLHGVVRGVSKDCSPYKTFTIAQWVWWEGCAVEGVRTSFQLWELFWSGGDGSTGITLSVDTQQERVIFSFSPASDEGQTIFLPFIPPGQWRHVVVSYSRGKFFSSSLEVFYDGVRVLRHDAAVPSPHALLPYSRGTSIVARIVSGSSFDLSCTVGFSRGAYPEGFTQRFLSFQLFNTALVEEEVVTLYCTNLHTFSGWSAGRKCPLDIPFLRPELLRRLTVDFNRDSLEKVAQSKFIRCVPFPASSLILSLDVKNALLVEGSCLTSLCNKQWMIPDSVGKYESSSFVLHGSHTEPLTSCGDASLALLSQGVTCEWSHWFSAVSTEHENLIVERSDEACDDVDVKMSALQKTAATTLRLIAALYWRLEATNDLHMTRFVDQVTSHVNHGLSVYLGTADGVEAFFALGAMEVCARDDYVLYNTSPIERIFFNWKIIASLPEASQRCVVYHLGALLRGSNPFRFVNAVRMRGCGFFEGFICGLVREYVQPSVLLSAMSVIKEYIQCFVDDHVVLQDILSFCAATVPVESDVSVVAKRLVTKMPVETFDCVVVTVRNRLLKVLCDLCTSPCSGEGGNISETLSRAVPQHWFHVLMHQWSHPVSVAMSLYLFVLCHRHSSSFRQRFSSSISLLYDSLRHHSHQEDVLVVLLNGFASSNWNMCESLPDVLGQLDISHDGDAFPSFLSLLLNILGINALLLLRSAAVVNYANTTARTFYAANSGVTVDKHGLLRRKCKCCCYAVLFCCRARGKRGKATTGKDGFCFTESVIISHTVLETSACAILEWIAQRYVDSGPVSKALYSSQAACNAIDMALLFLFPALQLGKGVSSSDGLLAALVDVMEGRSNVITQPHVRTELHSCSGSTECTGGDDCSKAREEDDESEGSPTPLDDGQPHCDFKVALSQDVGKLQGTCGSLFAAHIKQLARSEDKHALVTERDSVQFLPDVVLALHWALVLCPGRLEHTVQEYFSMNLCSFCLEALTDILNNDIDDGSGEYMLNNMVAIAQYLTSRMVSGAAVPVEALASFMHLLTERHLGNRQRTVVEESICEWLIFFISTGISNANEGAAGSVIDVLHTKHGKLFSVPVPTVELFRLVTWNLLELSYNFVLTNGECNDVRMDKLIYLWQTLVAVNRSSSFFGSVWTDENDSAQMRHVLFDFTCEEREEFATWARKEHFRLKQRLRMEEWTRRLVGRAAEQHKYNQLVESAVDERCRERTKFMASCEKAREMWKVWWEKFTSTVIIMDRLLPTAAGFNSNQTPQQAPVQLFPTYGLEDHARSLYLHPSGAVGYPFDWDNEFHKYSTVNYIRYSPIMCNVKADTLTDTDSVDSQKYMQEYAFLCRIAGPSMSTTIHFVSNVYYLRGDECVIAVLLVTGAEVVIIGDSQITSEGEFSIGRHNFHVNWEKALLANIFSDDDASDFLPWKSADSGATRGAILRHSLCFRNLCLDSSVLGSPALMWRFPIGSILRVHQRLFHHRPTATEFQLENGDIYFVVVIDDEFCFSRAKQRELMSAISNMAPHVVTETCSQKANRLSELVDLWRQRRISNRLYLLCLNDIAGRTVADMGQYPVMPWVITDYQSPSIDLKDANIYRDLTKPIGALNDTKAKQLRERYENWLDKSQPPFHHGTHYSSSAVVMYYLIRLQPYTNRSIRYQGGRLDIADRIFHSVPETWNSCGGVGDVKELIPEFFHLPAIFLNKSQVDLGIRSDGMEVGDVVLPSWCGGSVELFVRLQAAALEGEVVSDTLHKWIDLVFGYKQLGKKAVEATNVFLHLSYSDSVEQSLSEASSEEECRAIVATAANFGQTPTQLFKNPHCRRLNGERAPTCQQSFIESVSDLSTRWKSVYYPSNSRHHPGPITSLRIVDTYVAASTQFSLFLPTKPLQVCNYNTISKELHCRPRGESLLLCVLPSVWQHGHGELTAMCVSSLGGIVCLGTTKGKVVVCSRPSAMEPFTILAVLNTCGDKDQQPVKLLKMWDSGHIFVAYENEPQGSLWHVAHSQIMFCFAVNLNHIVGNSVCLRDVTQDRQNGHFFVATHDHVVHLSSTGEVLGTADTSLTNTAGSCAEGMGGSHLPSTAALPVAITSPVSSVEYMNFDSYDKTNVLLLGHENGVLSFWAVETPLDCHSEDVSTKMKPFFSITASTDKPITAIALDGEIISVGTSEGKVISFGSFDPFGENDF